MKRMETVGLSGHAGGGAGRAVWGRPLPLPYGMAIGMVLLMAVGAFLFAAFPPQGDPTLVTIDVLTGLVLVLLAVFLWIWGPTTRGDWALDLTIVLVATMSTLGVDIVPTHEGQIIVSVALNVIAMYAAAFRPPVRFAAELAYIITGYCVGIWLNPNPLELHYVLLASISVIITSVTVSLFANQLRRQALQDPLSGLLNRRGLDLVAGQIRAHADRSDLTVTVGLIDLDDFKSLNDREGHLAGDRVIVEVAQSWREMLRKSDVMARFGGDEFALILPGSTPDAAQALAARVRAADGLPWSCGFATWERGENLYDTLGKADRELYRDKSEDPAI